jgi:hypothetical protein
MKLNGMITSACVGFVTLGSVQITQAQGVGNVAALPNSFHQNEPAGWFIGTYGVIRDPDGPQWIKNLEGPQGGPFTAAPGQSFTLTESLYIEGNLPWMDWHEEILTPGWAWTDPVVFLANGLSAPGLTISPLPSSIINFDFDPLYPGTQITIRKQLEYIGGADGTPFVGTLRIAEYPTPEPASAALLGLGALPALWRRRNRSS